MYNHIIHVQSPIQLTNHDQIGKHPDIKEQTYHPDIRSKDF